MLTLALIATGIFLYFLPTLLARWRRCPETNQVFALDLYLGWTVIGWVAALKWSLDLPRQPSMPSYDPLGARALEIHNPRSISTWRWTVAFMLLAGVYLYLSLFVWPATPRLLAPDDQFINFDNARRMLEGQKLYGDIFQYTLPGTELLEVPLIRFFGPKLALIDALLIAAGVACAGLAFIEASAVLSRADAALSSLLFLTLGLHSTLDASHHKFSVLFVYAAAAVITRVRSPRRLAAAGVLLGLATCFTQTRGLVAIALGLFLLWENRGKPAADRHLLRDELSLFTPFAILVGLACAFVLWSGGERRFVRDILDFPVFNYTAGDANNWASSFADWPAVGSVTLWAGMKILVPGVYLAFLVNRWLSTKEERNDTAVALALLATVGFALYLTVSYAPLHIRLAEICMPAIILAVWFLNRSGERLWRVPAWAVAIGFLVVVPAQSQIQPYALHDTQAGTIAVSDPELSKEVTWIQKHTHSGDEFFAAYTTRLYVLLGLRNPARVPFVEPDDYTRPRQVVSTVESLRRAKPEFILWPFAPEDADDPTDRLYLIGEELRNCYQPVVRLYDGEVWQRRKGGCRPQDAKLSQRSVDRFWADSKGLAANEPLRRWSHTEEALQSPILE